MSLSHCPWVYNCVGINNHRQFFLYLINLTLGVVLYDWLVYYCKLACASFNLGNFSPFAHNCFS